MNESTRLVSLTSHPIHPLAKDVQRIYDVPRRGGHAGGALHQDPVELGRDDFSLALRVRAPHL